MSVKWRGLLSVMAVEQREVASRLSYSDKTILAPMVRAGRLPLRLLALKYGADIVYCEELIDRKILTCRRVENTLLNTVDFISPDGRCQFRTCPLEKDRVVFQMGTADPETALATAKMVENDVAGIDVNMGCPKDYSIKGGMGAALLTEPEKVRNILTTLVQGVGKPVTCKIRLLPSRSDTLRLVKVIESTGVSALAVHGRYRTERPEEHCHPDLIREVAQSVSIPVIANGGSLTISSYEDMMAFKKSTGCSSVMLARAALNNPSVFRREGLLDAEEVARDYVRIGLEFDEYLASLKYCLAIILKQFAKPSSTNRISHFTSAASNLTELSEVHNLSPYYESVLREREGLVESLSLDKQKELEVGEFSPTPSKKTKLDVEQTDEGLFQLHLKYDKRDFPCEQSPKAMVLEYARQKQLPTPVFTISENQGRLFKAIVKLGEWKYTTSLWSISKKTAEHSAALVALTHHGVVLSQKHKPLL